jgi:hypothetical protein
MFVSVRTYRCDPGQTEEILRRADEEFAPRISEEEGFCAYQILDCGDGWFVTVSEFRERDQAEHSIEMAAEFVRDTLADFDIERTDARTGEARVSVAAQEVLEPAHV